jgi:hypothetical protein
MQLEQPESTEPMTTDTKVGRRPGKLACLLFLALLAIGQIPKGQSEFVSQQGHYVVRYPKSWYLLQPGLPTLYISSFPPSRAVRAVIVPENGATISVVPSPDGIKDVEQWIARDGAAMQVKSRGTIVLRKSESDKPLNISQVLFESIEGPDTTRWYFELPGLLLVANLSYWKGDPNAEKHRQVLRDVVESARVGNRGQ